MEDVDVVIVVVEYLVRSSGVVGVVVVVGPVASPAFGRRRYL